MATRVGSSGLGISEINRLLSTRDGLKSVLEALHAIADVFTIVASGIAIFVYLRHRGEIVAAITLLLNYSYQTTLAELKEKLERLNEYTANEPTHIPEIQAILHEIAGQIKGNSRVARAGADRDLVSRLERLANGKKLTEPSKRSMVAEVREFLKTLNVDSVKDIFGEP
jgi:hypothetical protein